MSNESLTDLFTEAMQNGGSEAVEELVDDLEVDNPDDGTDDFENDIQEDEPEADDELEVDEDTGDETPPSDDEADDPDWWNGILERYGDRTVTLTVQGEPVDVKVKDLPNGFMMREDYSRKTAEVSKVTKAATWAQDVQEAFASDPVGTLQAFAQAYGIQLPNPAQPEDVVDPYEDLDPDVAAVLRKMDEQERRYESELSRVQNQLASFENQRIQEEIRAEIADLRDEFGDDLDTTEMLRIAAVHNMTLRESAEIVIGKTTYAKSKEQLAMEQVAREAATQRSGKSRAESKRRASGTATKKFDASNVSVEDFNTIGELFEIELNSVST
jgi:hypothetical protein